MGFLSFGRNKSNSNGHFVFSPQPFGPTFTVLSDGRIRILQGELTNQILTTAQDITHDDARLLLYFNGHRIGHCFAETDKRNIITIWDIGIEQTYQRKGLASLMVRILARELIFQNKVARFKFRMLQLCKSAEQEIRLQNVGIGVMMYKLGLSCEYNLTEVIKRNNIVSIDVLPPNDVTPPAYKIVLGHYPFVLIAFMIDWDTEKPIANYETYLKFKTRTDVIMDWSKTKAMIVGNANYFLRESGIREFINHLATSSAEAELFYKKVRGLNGNV